MVTLNDKSSGGGVVIGLVVVSVLFVGAAVFAASAYSKEQNYKNNVDQIAQTRVTAALKTEDSKKDAQFAQDNKLPLKVYAGPEAYGSIRLSYPKTWSAYVIQTANGSTTLDGYFQPDVVPSVTDPSSAFALRLQVVNQSTSVVLKQFDSFVTTKKATVTPYNLPNLKTVIGSRIDGAISSTKSGSMILLPLRDKTLKVWTEAPAYAGDFNNLILANLTFSP